MTPVTFEVLPTLAACGPEDRPSVEIRGLPAPGRLRVLHLGREIAGHAVDRDGVIGLGRLAPGGYGIEVHSGGRITRTALEVRGGTASPMRYGFVTDYRPGRRVDAVADNMRRLHLTDVQFYDWGFRHANLLGGGDEYADALGQQVSLDTVERLIDAVHGVGARALGYAAVYGVGNDEWPGWQHVALLTPSGTPYGLGDFLRLVDPADAGWLAHFVADLRAATDRLGFDGFHLDQYGYPKHATRPDGRRVSLEDSFASAISAARDALPAGRLVFNNVNNFPTWRTAGCAQDAVYVEVWPPHTTLAHLAAVADSARAAGDGKPVVVAAYQHVYTTADVNEADRATAFTMATLFSHGATHLLCGEADRILVDPYYVRNHPVAEPTAALLRRWYDFVVEHVEVLYDPSLVDVTGAFAGGYNDDCDVTYPGAAVTEQPTAGAAWRRILGRGDRLVMHLINLVGQDDTEWDSPRKPVGRLADGTLRIRRTGPGLPRVRVADPDTQASLRELDVTMDGDHAIVSLPSGYIWQMLVIDQGVS
jgi:dextranase